MKVYKVYDFDRELISTVRAKSFEDAFSKVLGKYAHREVAPDKRYDICIKCENEVKYIWVSWG